MPNVQQVNCPYCGDTWEVDLDSPFYSDQERIELTSEPIATIVCDDCLPLHMQ